MRITKPLSIVTTFLVMTLMFLFAGTVVQAQKKSAQPSNASASDQWLQFRGPNGSGVAEGSMPPAEFGPNKNLAWKAAVPFARSSPVVTANRVFLTASEGEKLITLALDRRTGKVMWRSEVARPRQMIIFKANDPASPSPVSDGKNVYAFFAELGLIAYGPTGKELWRMPLGPFNSFYGMAGSPVLVGNKLLMVCDHRDKSFVVAVDTRSGKLLWRKERSNFEAYSTPAIYTPKDGAAQLLVLGSQTLDSYSLDNGERLWWVTKVGSYTKGVPVVGSEMVYVYGEGGDAPFFPIYEDSLKKYDKDNDQRISLDEMKVEKEMAEHFGWLDANRDNFITREEYDFVRNSTTGGHGVTAVRFGGKGDLTGTNVAWTIKKSYPNIPAPLLYQGVIYLMKEGGILSSVNPVSGEVLKMGRTPEALEEYYASPVAADGKVYVVSASGKVTVVKAGAQWEILGTTDLGEEAWATPAIAGKNLYIRTKSSLYSFGPG